MQFNMDGGLTFYACTDLVVVGYNAELADVNNPRGELYGYRAFVVATDADGNRKRYYTDDALGVAECLQARWDNYQKPPVRFCDWEDTHPEYGSDAYMDYGAADDLAWEREMDV